MVVADESGVDDLQCYRTSKIYIERLVSHAHRTAAQFDRCIVRILENSVALKTEL